MIDVRVVELSVAVEAAASASAAINGTGHSPHTICTV